VESFCQRLTLRGHFVDREKLRLFLLDLPTPIRGDAIEFFDKQPSIGSPC